MWWSGKDDVKIGQFEAADGSFAPSNCRDIVYSLEQDEGQQQNSCGVIVSSSG